MKPDAYIPLYGNDFFEAVEGYSDAVQNAYIRALWHYWSHTHCGGLEPDDDYLRRVCRVEPSEWIRTKGIVFGKLFKLEDGFWHQDRCRREYKTAVEKYEKQMDRSLKGVAARRLVTVPKLDDPTVCATTGSTYGSTTGQTTGSTIGLTSSEPNHNHNQNHCTTERVGGQKIEMHHSFPKTEKEATMAAVRIGCPEEFAVTTWNKATSRGGSDARDVPIRSWSHYLATEWAYEQNRLNKEKLSKQDQKSAPGGSSGAAQLICDQKEYDRVLDRIKAIRACYTGDMPWKNDDKREIKALKTRRDELRKKLGVMV